MRDRDGASRVVLPERRLLGLTAVARVAANLAAPEQALSAGERQRIEVRGYGEWTWLRVFDREDAGELEADMREAVMRSTESYPPLTNDPGVAP